MEGFHGADVNFSLYLIYEAPETGIVPAALVKALNKALGYDELTGPVNGDTKIWRDAEASQLVKSFPNVDNRNPQYSNYPGYNAAYEWVEDHFQKVTQ